MFTGRDSTELRRKITPGRGEQKYQQFSAIGETEFEIQILPSYRALATISGCPLKLQKVHDSGGKTISKD